MAVAARTLDAGVQRFIKEVRDTARHLPKKHLVPFIKKITFECLIRIVNRTPVDKGRARGNWQVTIGSPATGTVPDTDIESGRAPTGGRSSTVEKGLAAVSNVGPFDSVFIHNNVSYIEVLENGRHSTGRQLRGSMQAPHGMVKVSLAEMEQQFK